MSETTTKGSPVKVEYPTDTIKLSETTRDLRGYPDPARVAAAKQLYQKDPKYVGNIFVTPDGTLIVGEEDLRAAQRAGIDRVPVTVRKIVGADPWALQRAMIEIALARPDTPPMARIRCLLWAYEHRRIGGIAVAGLPAIYDRRKLIMSTLGCTRKDAQRYLALYTCPLAVQHAFDCGLLNLDDAAHIAKLTEEDQLDVAEMLQAILEIASGGSAKEHILRCVTSKIKRCRPDLVPLSDALERVDHQVRCLKVNRPLHESEFAKINKEIGQLRALRDSAKLKDSARLVAK